MKFYMPDKCSMCLGTPTDRWPIVTATGGGEENVRSEPRTRGRGAELTMLNLNDNEGGVFAPVCVLCRRRLKTYGRIRVAIGLTFIICGSIVCYAVESYIGFGVFWIISALLARSEKSWANKPVLNRLRLEPAEFRDWDIFDAEARQMCCRVQKGRLLVPTEHGEANGDNIPVFTNPEYQRMFNAANGITPGYGVPRSHIEGSIYGVGVNKLRK